MTKIQNIGVLTSGGDAPGMNACIRAIVRQGIHDGFQVFGVYDGFNGLIDGEISKLEYEAVSNIIHRGGTILRTARSERFLEEKYRLKAFENLKSHKIDALVVLGGDGSFKGAEIFHQEHNLPYIGIPCTIDNDIAASDYTIGFDTALNTIIEAIDKIKDTASAHNRIFLVEVMGNDSGLIALNTALVTGSEDVFIPEIKEDYALFEQKIERALAAKKSSVIIVAEGDEIGGAKELYNYLKEKNLHQKLRVTVLGHIQRGGSPSYLDRKMATDFGVESVKKLLQGEYNIVVGIRNGKLSTSKIGKNPICKKIDYTELVDIIHTLSVY